ncbi:MAG: hypothetical protein ACRDQV_11590 [Pseudonocardiaceae bacterium]
MGVGEDDEVPVEIADPDLPMASVRVEVYVGDDLGDSSAGLLVERERRLVISAANFHALAAPAIYLGSRLRS